MTTATTIPPSFQLRDLNDYESMLATSTCNVGLAVTIVSNSNGSVLMKSAWRRTVAERAQLHVKLIAKTGDGSMGPLGKRYSLVHMEEQDHNDLFHYRQQPAIDNNIDLLQQLQQIGTTALDINNGSYYVVCTQQPGTDKEIDQKRVYQNHAHNVSNLFRQVT